MKLGMYAGLGPGHLVLDRDPAPPPPKGHRTPQFWGHKCCGQMAAWIKMELGMEVGLGPGDFVLDGDRSPSPKRGRAPNFQPMFIVAKWMGTQPPSQKGADWLPPQFSAHFYCGQTAG